MMGSLFFEIFFMTSYSFHCRVLREDLQSSEKTDNLQWRYASRGKNNHLQIYTTSGTFVGKWNCFWVFPERIKLFVTQYSRNMFSAVSPAWTISKHSQKIKNLKQSILQSKFSPLRFLSRYSSKITWLRTPQKREISMYTELYH